MNFINYISSISIPLVIIIILLYGIFEKKEVFDIFLKGSKDGINIVLKIFPTLIGLFLAIGALRSSGIIDFFIYIINPFIKLLKIPEQIVPLIVLRPISRKRGNCNRNRYNEKLWRRFISRSNCINYYRIN